MTYPLFKLYDEFGKLKPVFGDPETNYEVNQVQCGENFQVFLTNKGEVYTCGSNKFGQLGLEKDSDDEEGDEEGKEEDELDVTPDDDPELTAFIDP